MSIANQAITDACLESQSLLDYSAVRQASIKLIEPLTPEDCALQAEAFVSPAKWHLAHTSWFFETFILMNTIPEYQPFNDDFQVLFNSYYNGIGEQFSRPKRHLLSRPSLDEVLAYRQHIDDAMIGLSEDHREKNKDFIQLGLHHEQQHQELLLMDLKYCFFQNPLFPKYLAKTKHDPAPLSPIKFVSFSGGLKKIGALPNTEFSFDNESPHHTVFLQDFSLSNRLVSNGEYLKFIEDGGYQEPSFWLSDGWSHLQNKESKKNPLYWYKKNGQWFEFTLHGLVPLNLNEPVSHLNFYEASAYAQSVGCRLPSESEWEVAALNQKSLLPLDINGFHSLGADDQVPLMQLYGECWQWTQSAYQPYPGFKAPQGAVGEYNGKFMCNQMVLRGGCRLTPQKHIRASYRNFFYPQDQWPMTGLRLAKD